MAHDILHLRNADLESAVFRGRSPLVSEAVAKADTAQAVSGNDQAVAVAVEAIANDPGLGHLVSPSKAKETAMLKVHGVAQRLSHAGIKRIGTAGAVYLPHAVVSFLRIHANLL